MGFSDHTLASMPKEDKETIVACYAVSLSKGATIKGIEIGSACLKKYFHEVEKMTGVKTRGAPVNPRDIELGIYKKDGIPEVLHNVLKEHERWEGVPRLREPLTRAMVDEFHDQAEGSHIDSLESTLRDWLTIAIVAGFRKSEWIHDTTKTTETGGPFHLNVDGSVKGFIRSDFRLEYMPVNDKNKSRKKIKIRIKHKPNMLKIKWRFQKNGNNNQVISFAANPKVPKKCPVAAAVRILDRAERLQVPAHHPIAVFYENKRGVYLTDRVVAASLRECAKTVYCLDDQKAINDYTCHSPRIGACVLLHCGGSNELTIKTRLRWESDAFLMYLRNVPCLAAQHNFICNEYDMDNMDPV